MLQLSKVIERLKRDGQEWLAEQSLLDLSVTETVIRALDTLANPKSVPVGVKQQSANSDSVEFDFGCFTAKTYVETNDMTKVDSEVVQLIFKEGLIIRESTMTLPLMYKAILDYLGMETHYQSGNSLKIDNYSGKLHIVLKTKLTA